MAAIAATLLSNVFSVAAIDQVTADDRAVMAAVLDGALRPERDQAIRRGRGIPSDRGPTGAVFLILDRTVPACSGKPIAASGRILGCFDVNAPAERRLLGALKCDSAPDQIGTSLARRNQTSMTIRGSLAGDATLVSTAYASNAQQLTQLRRQYSRGSALVVFSAPAYPKANVAVVYYRAVDAGSGFVCLARDAKGWTVRSR
jgi:hypothetical protein